MNKNRPGAPNFSQGHLQARPGQPANAGSPPVGLQKLELNEVRDTLIYVPAGYQARQPAPLAVMLHGAGGQAENGLAWLRTLADATDLLLLAPSSRAASWDIISLDTYGPDIELINRALELTFQRYRVDPARLAIGGFSDGASYALSVGLTNGDLFTHIIACSPGFMAPATKRGRPRIYISHGTQDLVLPIEPCSRKIAPHLERAGYDLLYREFEGPHTIPPHIAQEAVDWFCSKDG